MSIPRKPLPNNSHLLQHSRLAHDEFNITPLRSVTAPASTRTLNTSSSTVQGDAYTAYEDALDGYFSSSPVEFHGTSNNKTEMTEQRPTVKLPPGLQYTEQTNDFDAASSLEEQTGPTSSGPANNDPLAGSKRLKVVTALEDTSIFLGGLIKHPTESTKHITILRHSHGLVYYKGPNTSIALTVFSDQPIAPDKRYWLQLKGWSGHTGMAAKALFRANSNWIEVTPQQLVAASDVRALDERAWQRDIKKFLSNAKGAQKRHVTRETVIIRIPYDASDGYFRVVLTSADSRTVLCPSPVFRLASTSMSASSLKGASIRTLPIEIGVKVAQITATKMATNMVGPVALGVKSTVMSAVPASQYGSYAQTAYEAMNVQDHLRTINDRYEERVTNDRNDRFRRVYSAPTPFQQMTVGDDLGPEPPYPVHLEGKVAKGTGQSTVKFCMPTANLDEVHKDLLAPLPLGVYFGWGVLNVEQQQKGQHQESWYHALISIVHDNSNTVRVAQPKVIRAYLIHDFEGDTNFLGFKLRLSIMGYLHPITKDSDPDSRLLEIVNDITRTQASLARDAWSHEETLRRVQTMQSTRSLSDRFVDMRITGQRQIDRMPVHALGLRVDDIGASDRSMYGVGGLWIKRD